MAFNMNIELKKVLLRRRNKVIVNSRDSICDVFKDGLIKRIHESEALKNHCTIESCQGINVKVTVDEILMEFTNGELISKQNLNKTENTVEKEVAGKLPILTDTHTTMNDLFIIIKEETEKIKNRMVYALSFNENINSLGYSMDENMLNVVAILPVTEIEKLSNELIPLLKEMVGANVTYHPFYPNFPKQVMEMKWIDLYINALLHYWSNGTYIPYTKEEQRPISTIEVEYKNITIGKEEDLHDIMKNLMNAAEAISPQDIADLTTYISSYEKFMEIIPEMIPNKENLAIITNLVLTYCKEPSMESISRRFTTVTDVLRLAAVMSGQSATLDNVRFKSFSNKERRFIMYLLNNCHNRREDFYRHKNMWERVCERIHPLKFKKDYPDLVEELMGDYLIIKEIKSLKKQIQYYEILCKFYKFSKNKSKNYEIGKNYSIKLKKAFQEVKKDNLSNEQMKLYNQIWEIYSQICSKSSSSRYSTIIPNIKLFESKKEELQINLIENENKLVEYKKTHQRYATKVEYLLLKKDYDNALQLISQKPGEFTRRLDELLSRVKDHEKVIKVFEKVASKVSIKVLFSLKGYFQKRQERLKVRVFLIKGETPKFYIKKIVKKELDIDLCEKICHICDQALMTHFEEKETMNKVFISEDLKKYVIPMDLRSANSALETYSKGSRLNISYKQLTKEEQQMMIKDKEEDLIKAENELYKKNTQLDQLKQKISNSEIEDQIEKVSEENIQLITDEIEKLENEISLEQETIEKLKSDIKKDKMELNREKGNMIRLFIWWTNTKNQRVDIDLSVMIYDENLLNKGHVSYTSLRNDKFQIYHSGDVIDGGDVNGCGSAEFIDFDPKQIVKAGARYIAVSVISFCGTYFKNMENCKFGWMERNSLNSNELFEPKTVRQKLDLNSASTSTVPVVFDCKTCEIIWVDTVLTQNECFVNIENFGNFTKTSSISNNDEEENEEENENGWVVYHSRKVRRRIRKRMRRTNPSHQFIHDNLVNYMNGLLYFYINPLKDNMYNLVQLHVQARNGQLAESEKELCKGDTAFVTYLPYKCIEGVNYIRPMDLDIILSEYMT